MMLTGAPVDSGMFWNNGSLWFWPPTSGPLPSHASLEHPSCWAPISWLPVIFLLPPSVSAETISRWPGPPCLQEEIDQTLDNLGHQGTEPPCDSETALPQECKVWRLLRNSVWALLWFFQCMWGWALCPGHKEQGLWKGQSLWDSSEPRTEKASFPVLQSKTHGGLISLVSSLGNVFTKLHLTE